MIHKKRTLRHFGISQLGAYRGPKHERFITDIKDAITENQVVALIGSFGDGKSTIARMAVGDLMHQKERYKFVYVDSADLERLSTGQILDAIITDLSSEGARRSTQARSRQARRIMGELVAMGKKICLVVDNAHRLHPNVLLALKDEHEKHYLGYEHVFSILYIGQEKLLGKLDAYKEVFWRTMLLNLLEEGIGWMDWDERLSHLQAVYGEAIDEVARERIARKASKPLAMEYFVNEKMEEAMAAGKQRLDGETVQLSLRERREAQGVSLQELADKAGIGKTTAYDIERGKPSTKKSVLEKALAEMEKKKAEVKDGVSSAKASATKIQSQPQRKAV